MKKKKNMSLKETKEALEKIIRLLDGKIYIEDETYYVLTEGQFDRYRHYICCRCGTYICI